MLENAMKIKSFREESLIKKLAMSFFFMSLIPIMLMLYIITSVGFDTVLAKFPYIRVTIFFTVCLVVVFFALLRVSIHSIDHITKMAKGIANGNYDNRIEVKEMNEIGQLARSFNKITGELETKIKELQESKNVIHDIFRKIGSAISASGGADQLLVLIIETTTKGVFAESGCIMFLDEKKNELHASVCYGMDEKSIKKISIKPGEGIIGLSVKEKRAIISSFTSEPLTASADKTSFYYKNLISVPLLYREDCLGVLVVFDKKEAANFNEDDKVLVSNVASQAAIAIANAKLNENAEQTYIETITALAVAVEAKDLYSRGHLDRVSRLVVQFAEYLKLSAKTIDVLKDGAKLHDLGKIGVRDDILRKKEPLTEEEQQELQKHVIIGENILRPIRSLAPLCDMVRHHQEWWDGTGYPDKLRQEEIPLTARILKIVDAYDAMSTDRPYRKALSKEQIKEQFTRGSGKEFDPHLAEKFLEIV